LNYQEKNISGRKQSTDSFPSLQGRYSSLKLLIFLALFFLASTLAAAQAPQEKQDPAKRQTPYKVAILPVTIHSPENIEFMREGLLDMLSSRIELEGRVSVVEKQAVKKALTEISGEIDQDAAKKLGAQLGVDYVIFGSLTKLGDSASLDLKVVDAKGEKAISSVFEQAKKMEEIVAGVGEISRKVDEKILGYSLAPPVVAKTERPPQETASIPQIPSSGPGFRPYTPQGRAVAVAPSVEFWQSQPLSFKVRGIAIGDLDGDGRNEVVMIGPRELSIYRLEKGELKLLKRHEGKKMDNYLAVDVGDINKDGKAEIFVTNFRADQLMQSPQTASLSSFAATFQNDAFKIVEEDMDWFLRVVEWGSKGTVLLAQAKGLQTAFEGPIVELGWDGKKYKQTRKTDLPKGYCLYGFAPFEHGGKSYSVFIEPDFRLKVTNEKGKVVWRSQGTYGSDIAFRVKPMTTGPGAYEGDDLAFINVRVISRGNEVFLIRNISPVGQLFKRTKYYTGGEVQSLVWTGAMLTERWKSQEISGYVADFQMGDIDGNQGKELIVAVNLPKESMLSGDQNSAVLITRMQ